jgi:hypothetical protein
MREKVFISHATPEDDNFTKWLSLKLISLGYEVWCDILFLDKGIDFWSRIEKEIRENTFKFLIVSSSSGNQRDGVLKELAIAAKTKKQLKDETFIIPLAIDEMLSYDNINIEIVRLNAIDFRISWANGLKDLLDAFEKQNVPKNSPDPERSNLLYQQIFLHNKGVIEKEEIYDSNWFPIISFPPELRFHEYGLMVPKNYDVRNLTFPALRYKNYLCTFAWEYDFMHQLPKTETYSGSKTIRIPTTEILSGKYDSDFIRNYECQRLIVQILNMAFEFRMKTKGVREYQMSNKTAYWIEKGKLEKDKFEKVQLIGKLKEKNWHFGISCSGKLYPFHVLMISTHIFFTMNGIDIIESKSIQHSSRRKQGKNWWNDKWREKLLTFMNYISDDENSFFLEVGSEEKIVIANMPLKFVGKKSYHNPSETYLDEEIELSEINDYEDESDELKEVEEIE